MSKAERFELFQKSLESPTPLAAAFTTSHGSSQCGVALLVLDMVAGMAPATSHPITDRVVPNPFKVADHHGARFATWTTTMLIDAGNSMIDPNMIPQHTLQKLSTLHALCLETKPLIGS